MSPLRIAHVVRLWGYWHAFLQVNVAPKGHAERWAGIERTLDPWAPEANRPRCVGYLDPITHRRARVDLPVCAHCGDPITGQPFGWSGSDSQYHGTCFDRRFGVEYPG